MNKNFHFYEYWVKGSGWRFFIGLFSVFLLPSALLSFLLFKEIRQSASEHDEYQNRAMAKLAARVAHEHFDGLINSTDSFSRSLLLLSALESKNKPVVQKLLEEFALKNTQF